MAPWPRGKNTIDGLLAERRLERISGSAAVAQPWLEQAERRLTTAEHIVEDDPESAFILVYDAARFAAVALLAQQGLRPTQAGGHLAVCEAVNTQFGGPLQQLTVLRRRRNELEYPAFPGERIEPAEVDSAVRTARTVLDTSWQLVEHLSLYA